MDRTRAHEAIDEARHAVNDAAAAGDTEVTVRIGADAEGLRYLDEPGTYCPAPLPCLGMTGIRIAVPVRVVSADPGAEHRIGEPVGELTATYCPDCRTMKADERR